MDSGERFSQVINGQIPDRVPVTLFIQDQGHFLNQMFPDVDPLDFEEIQLKVIEIQRQFGVDVFVRQLFGLNDPRLIFSCYISIWVVIARLILRIKQ